MTATDAGFWERGDSEFLFDFDQFERMDGLGLFSDIQGHVELIEGKIVHMAPTSADHGGANADLLFAIMSALRKLSSQTEFKVLTDANLRIDAHSAPQPDVLVIRVGEGGKYVRAEQAVLVAEVSISTRGNDLTTKGRLYAEARVPEYWVVEPERRKLSVFRDPQPDGAWASVTVLEGDAYVSPLFSSEIHIPLSELF